ncbi:MAG: hypothetical protein KAJ10_14070 [Thermodesulfovibrionia bacterium]|nr:hypothetical protein [Thermodesulfovibrionia bacterium]
MRFPMILLLCGGFSFSAISQSDNNDSIVSDTMKTNSGNSVSASDYADIKNKVDEIIEFRNEEEFEQLVIEGIELFNGTKRLENKGASCISCHVLNYPGISQGGLLGIDLSNSYTNVNKEKGLQIIFKTPTSPIMKIAYANNPFTYEETMRLIAVLKKADEEKDYQLSSVNKAFMLIYGIPGFLTILSVMLIIWNKRLKRSVKQDIYNRQIKTI